MVLLFAALAFIGVLMYFLSQRRQRDDAWRRFRERRQRFRERRQQSQPEQSIDPSFQFDHCDTPTDD
jgi:hypothetical protein